MQGLCIVCGGYRLHAAIVCGGHLLPLTQLSLFCNYPAFQSYSPRCCLQALRKSANPYELPFACTSHTCLYESPTCLHLPHLTHLPVRALHAATNTPERADRSVLRAQRGKIFGSVCDRAQAANLISTGGVQALALEPTRHFPHSRVSLKLAQKLLQHKHDSC